jgi:hypothetical protein
MICLAVSTFLAVLASSGPVRADDGATLTYRTAPAPDKAPPGSASSAPALVVPGLDTSLRASMPDKDEGLAGDPNAPFQDKPRLSAAEQDSYFNTQEYKNMTTLHGRRGHASVGDQAAGVAESAAMNGAADALGSLLTGR